MPKKYPILTPLFVLLADEEWVKPLLMMVATIAVTQFPWLGQYQNEIVLVMLGLTVLSGTSWIGGDKTAALGKLRLGTAQIIADAENAVESASKARFNIQFPDAVENELFNQIFAALKLNGYMAIQDENDKTKIIAIPSPIPTDPPTNG